MQIENNNNKKQKIDCKKVDRLAFKDDTLRSLKKSCMHLV